MNNKSLDGLLQLYCNYNNNGILHMTYVILANNEFHNFNSNLLRKYLLWFRIKNNRKMMKKVN